MVRSCTGSSAFWLLAELTFECGNAVDAWACLQCLSVCVYVCVSCVLLQNRGRLAEKRTIPLPPTRVPKKELASVFSSDESEGGERSSTDHADIKQEEELHYTTMRKR